MTYQLMMKQKNKVKWDLNNKAIWNIPLGIQNIPNRTPSKASNVDDLLTSTLDDTYYAVYFNCVCPPLQGDRDPCENVLCICSFVVFLCSLVKIVHASPKALGDLLDCVQHEMMLTNHERLFITLHLSNA